MSLHFIPINVITKKNSDKKMNDKNNISPEIVNDQPNIWQKNANTA